MAGEPRQVDVAIGSRKAVAQAGSVDEEWNLEILANAMDGFEFARRIERAELGGEGDIDHAGKHHVRPRGVGVETTEIVLKLRRRHLAIVRGQGEHLVAVSLDGARLVYVDMARFHGHHALVGAQHRVDDGGVGLGAADEEENLGFGTLAGPTNFLTCRLAPFVVAIGGALAGVRVG